MSPVPRDFAGVPAYRAPLRKGRGEAVVLHHVADDQRPDRPGDEADEIVNREGRIGGLRAGEIADHGLGQRSARLHESAVENQIIESRINNGYSFNRFFWEQSGRELKEGK